MATSTRELLKKLRDDGWELVDQEGSHMQFKHPVKPGKVTVTFHGSNKDVHPKVVKSILKQAGLD